MNDQIRTDRDDQVLELQLNVLVFQQGEYYLAYCPSIELSSYGDSIEDAKVGFDDMMRNYLDEAQKRGTLREDLLGHGWQINTNNENAAPPQMVDLDIPAGLLKKQFNESWKVPVSC